MKLDDGVSFRLTRVARLLSRPYGERLRRYNMTAPQLFLMLALYERDNLTAGALAERVHLDKSTLTGILTRLEHNGLIERTPDENDGRSVRVTLTEKGRKLRRPLTRIFDEVNRCIVEALGESHSDLSAILSTLERAAGQAG